MGSPPLARPPPASHGPGSGHEGRALEPACPVPVPALPRARCASQGVTSHRSTSAPSSGKWGHVPASQGRQRRRCGPAGSSVSSLHGSASRIPLTTHPLPCPQEVGPLGLLASLLVSLSHILPSVRGQPCVSVSGRSRLGPGPAESGRAGRATGAGLGAETCSAVACVPCLPGRRASPSPLFTAL